MWVGVKSVFFKKNLKKFILFNRTIENDGF